MSMFSLLTRRRSLRTDRSQQSQSRRADAALARACTESLEPRRLMAVINPHPVSVDSSGVIGNAASPPTSASEPGYGPRISTTGQFIVFDSSATNLDPAATGAGDEVYIRNTVSNTTRLVSIDTSGNVAPNAHLADATPDGRYVLFYANGGSGNTFLYRRDTINNNTILISVGYDPFLPQRPPRPISVSTLNGKIAPAAISDDGNRVVYVSSDQYVNPAFTDNNLTDDIFVRDVNQQKTILVDVGTQSNNIPSPATGTFYSIDISPLGNLVLFDTDRTGIGGFGTNATNSTALRRVLIRNINNSTTVDVSAGATGTTGGSGTSAGTNTNPVFSRLGNAVGFLSDSAALAGASTGNTGTTATVQAFLAHIMPDGTVTGVDLASRSIGGGPSAGSALANPRPSGDGRFLFFWDDGGDLVSNPASATNLYRYNSQTDKVELVTIGSNGLTTFSPNISASDDGRFVGWAANGTDADLSVDTANYGPSSQLNAFARDMNSSAVRLLNVSSTDPTSAANGGASSVLVTPDGQQVFFDSTATDLDPAVDSNANPDYYLAHMPAFPVAQVTTLVDAPDVYFGGATAYYFLVTYNSANPVKLSTLGDDDISVSSASNGYVAQAHFVSANLSANGTPISGLYYVVPPGGSWDFSDNSTTTQSFFGFTLPGDRYVIHQNGGRVADTQGNPFPDSDIGSFRVDIGVTDTDGFAITQSVNENAGSVTVNFTRTDKMPGNVSVHYATVPGTASPGQDYTAVSGDLTNIAPNATVSITVPIINDDVFEGAAPETFRVVLTGATNGALFNAQQAIVLITDDDANPNSGGGGGGGGSQGSGTITIPPTVDTPLPGGVTISLNNGVPTIVAPETAGTITVPVNRAGTGTTAVPADLTYTVYSMPGDTAVPSVNYVLTSGTLHFSAGNDTPDTPLTVQLLHDFQVTGDRTFTIVISDATNGVVLTGASIKVDEIDVDSAVAFSASSLSTTDNNTVDITLNRTGNLTPGATVTLNISGLPTSAYSLLPGTGIAGNVITFGPGESAKTLHLRLNNSDVNNGVVSDLLLSLGTPTTIQPGDGITYGTVIGSPSTETLHVQDIDVAGPQVTALNFKTSGDHITSITVTFNEKVTAASAKRLANYVLFQRDEQHHLGQIVTLASARYNAATHTVTLTPASPLPTGFTYQLNVNGGSEAAIARAKGNLRAIRAMGGILDLAGNPLDGNNNTAAGGTFIAKFATGRTISYAERDNDIVTFSLKGPGTLKMVSLNGSVTLDVLNPDGENTTLIGTVTRRKPGNGRASIALLRLRGATYNPGSKFDIADLRSDV